MDLVALMEFSLYIGGGCIKGKGKGKGKSKSKSPTHDFPTTTFEISNTGNNILHSELQRKGVDESKPDSPIVRRAPCSRSRRK